jgi:hypothetical protein
MRVLLGIKQGEKVEGEAENPNFVVNKSPLTFSEDEMKILNNGLKFRPPPKKPLYDEIVVRVESAIKCLNGNEKGSLRKQV